MPETSCTCADPTTPV